MVHKADTNGCGAGLVVRQTFSKNIFSKWLSKTHVHFVENDMNK